MKILKYSSIVFLCLLFFGYGMASLEYKLFPYYQIMDVKIYLTFKQNQDQPVQVINTFLRKLLVKKVFIDKEIFRGGAMANVDDYLFIVGSKGELSTYDLQRYQQVDTEIEKVPMNYEELLKTDYPKRSDFKMAFFRVSGMYAERSSEGGIDIYVTHHNFDKDNDCVHHQISKMSLAQDAYSLKSIDSWQTIFSAEPCIELNPDHYVTNEPFVGHEGGGKIIAFNDSTLMVSVGEYGKNGLNQTEAFSQNTTVPYGKVILLDKNNGTWSAFANGIRNPLGLYRDSNGTIWETENGPKGGDELNIIEGGYNYGWPEVSYGVWYDHSYTFNEDKPRGVHTGYKEPAFAWLHAIAPTNLIRIEGEKYDTWQGDLIIGTMKDKSLHRLRLSEDNRVVYTERIPLGHRIRDLIALSNDTIALITDDGFLIIIDDGGSVFEKQGAETEDISASLDLFEGLSKGAVKPTNQQYSVLTSEIIFEQNCANCHALNKKVSVGPHLNNLFDREVGKLDGFSYSTSLINDNRKWTHSLLRNFLKNPDSEFPGNYMPEIELTSAEIDSIIVYLESHDS